MSTFNVSDWSVAFEQHTNIKTLSVYGRNENVGTSWQALTMNGLAQFPAPADAQFLRIRAGGDVADTAAGTGARKILLNGIDQFGNELSETLDTAGTSASSFTATKFLRLNEALVIEGGTYVTDIADTHAATIIIEDVNTLQWAEIPFSDGLAHGSTGHGFYSTPVDKEAYFIALSITPEANKPVDVFILGRVNYLKETAPFPSGVVVSEWRGLETSFIPNLMIPTGPVFSATDLVFYAKVASGSAAVSVNFTLALRKSS